MTTLRERGSLDEMDIDESVIRTLCYAKSLVCYPSAVSREPLQEIANEYSAVSHVSHDTLK